MVRDNIARTEGTRRSRSRGLHLSERRRARLVRGTSIYSSNLIDVGRAAVALAVGLLVFQLLTDIQERYQAMLDRLLRIVELNHHIRNALQVISYNNVPDRSEQAIQQVNAEILRIESVLREVSAALGTHADLRGAPTSRRERHNR
jgi:hypothetical protein